MTTTISALTTAQPANADVFEFEVLNASSGKATRANVLTAATAEAISLTGNASSSITISAAGAVAVTLGAASSGSVDGFQINIPSSTALTAGADVHVGLHIVTNSVQHATGAITTLRDNLIEAVTHTAVAASVITTDGTLVISGAPIAGTNVTITNPYALWVQAGKSSFGDNVQITSSAFNVGLTFAAGGQSIAGNTNGILNLNADATIQINTHTGGGTFAIFSLGGSATSFQFFGVATTRLAMFIRGVASRANALLQLQTSAAGSLGNVGGCVFDDFADTATTHTDGTFDTLSTHTTVANSLVINGDKITFDYTCTVVSSATATREFKLTFATIPIFDSTAETFAATGTVRIWGYIVRKTSTTCRAVVNYAPSGSATIVGFAQTQYTPDGTLTGLTLSGTNVLALTAAAAGTGAAASDITNTMATVSIIPAGS